MDLSDHWPEIESRWQEKGLRVFQSAGIQEVLGDAGVKAVRLNTGKVLASDMVIFTKTIPDFRVFSDEEISINKQVPLAEGHKSVYDGLYLIGELFCGSDSMEQSLNVEQLVASQAKRASFQIIEQPIDNNEIVFSAQVQFNGIHIEWADRHVEVQGISVPSNDSDENREGGIFEHLTQEVKQAAEINEKSDNCSEPNPNLC